MKCKMTTSGKHLFMPLFSDWLDQDEVKTLKIWKLHGVENPLKCIACGVINDLTADQGEK